LKGYAEIDMLPASFEQKAAIECFLWFRCGFALPSQAYPLGFSNKYQGCLS
jgi:hypothetical protein